MAVTALRILNEATSVKEYLDTLIELKPPLVELTKTSPLARTLLLRLITVPAGFKFLCDSTDSKRKRWLDTELCMWDMF